MESGAYLLTEEQKEAKATEEKEARMKEKSIQKRAKRAESFVPPKVFILFLLSLLLLLCYLTTK